MHRPGLDLAITSNDEIRIFLSLQRESSIFFLSFDSISAQPFDFLALRLLT